MATETDECSIGVAGTCLSSDATDGHPSSPVIAVPSPFQVNNSTTVNESAQHANGNNVNPVVLNAMPSFFANPFMTPFMPQQQQQQPLRYQQSSGEQQQQQPTLVIANNHQANSYTDFRANPLPAPNNYLLQSVQCQEMMQHYIQSLISAASRLPHSSSERLNQETGEQLHETVETDQGSQKFPVAYPTFIHNISQQLYSTQDQYPEYTDNTVAAFSHFESSPTAVLQQFKKEEDSKKDKSSSENHTGPSQNCKDGAEENEAQSNENSQDKDDCCKKTTAEDIISGEFEKLSVPLLENATCSRTDGIQNDGSLSFVNSDLSSEATQEPGKEGTTVGSSLLTSTSTPIAVKNDSIIDSREQQQLNDCRTAVLIKKQMSEIEREINRRAQNKNIKKSGLAFNTGGGSSKSSESDTVKPTLEQLRNSYGLSSTAQAAANTITTLSSTPISQSLEYQQNLSSSSAKNSTSTACATQLSPPLNVATAESVAQSQNIPQLLPQFRPYFPPPQAFYFPGAQQHVSPQLAAAILQQFQQNQQFNLYQGAASFQCQNVQPSGTQETAVSSSSSSLPNGGGMDEIDKEYESKIPPPPAAPSNNIRRKSLPQNGRMNTSSDVKNLVGSKNESGTIKYSQNGQLNKWPGDDCKIVESQEKSAGERNLHKKRGGENESGEPVWVMRDSYLKRIQREEERINEVSNEKAKSPESSDVVQEDLTNETESLLAKNEKPQPDNHVGSKKASKKEVIVHEPAVLIEGVLFRARYLGSTQLLCEGRPTKASRMMQSQEAVARVKAPAGEIQPSTDIDLFISTEKIMVLNTDLQRISDTDVRQDILMDHALRTISYIADIGDLVVLMARRMSHSAGDDNGTIAEKAPRVICHVFESEEASFIAQSIGQAFQVAYVEFLRANGIDDPSYLREIDYQEVLNSQELMGDELEMFARKETQKDVVVPKKTGEPLGVVVVESGWGSMLPTVVIANLQPNGAASRCNLLNIGDQIIAINGISLVGLPLAAAQQNIKAAKCSTAVKLTVVSTPPVVEVRIKRPDTKYQLGFSVQNGVICSLLRGGIAERGGIRVGHRIIEINSQSVVAVPHDRIVNLLATAIGEIHMKTMPTSVFRLLTGQEVPNYI